MPGTGREWHHLLVNDRSRITLRDVARAASVSPSAAASALRGDGRLHSETRARVLAAAEQLGYRPNAVARTLRKSNSGVVATVLFDMPTEGSPLRPNSFWEQAIFSYVQELARANLGNVLVPATHPGMLSELPAAAVVVFNLPQEGPPVALQVPPGTPVVRVISTADVGGEDAQSDGRSADAAQIIWGYDSALSEVLDHLSEAGAVRPGMLLPPKPLMPTAMVRRAYQTWCRIHDQPVLLSQSPDLGAGIRDLVDRGCDAFVFHEDASGGDADAVLGAIHDMGLRVPRDVMVASIFSGNAEMRQHSPLTSVVYDGWASGASVAHAVIEGLKTGDFPDILFRWEIQARESTRR